jgi:cyclohexyl-isocyanide hydratase
MYHFCYPQFKGGVVTAQGVTASIDLEFHLVERIAGREARARIAKQVDYPYAELPQYKTTG